MRDIIDRLTALCHPRSEAIDDGIRLTEFVHVGNDASAEITRLRAELATARERVAGAYLAAADTAYLWHDDDDAQELRETIRALTPADATAALEARDARVRAEERAKVIEEAKAAVSDINTHTAPAGDGQTYILSPVYGPDVAKSLDALHTPESRKAGGEQ